MKKFWDSIERDDVDAAIILLAMFVIAFAVGLLTSMLGNWFWHVFARVGASSPAVEWIAHALALFASCFAVWSVLCRLCGEKRWPWVS